MKEQAALLTAAGPDRDIRAMKTAESLTRAGYRVTVLCGRPAAPLPEQDFRVEAWDRTYPAEAGVGRKLWEKLRFFLWLSRRVRNGRFEILHACNLDMLAAAVLCRRRNARIVYDSYEICTEKEGLVSQSPLLHRLAVWAEAQLVPKAAGMLCVSRSAEAYFRRTYPELKNLKVVTNAPRSRDCPVHRHSLPLRAVYIGLYGKNRGIEELVEGLNGLPAGVAEGELYGFGPLEPQLKALARPDRVRVGGWVEPDRIHGLLTGRSVGAVLTRPTSLNHRLTVSNKLFDYLHAGLPVLMSDVEEHRLLNRRYRFGLILPEVTAEEVGKALLTLAEDPGLYEQLSENAAAAARELNWEQEEKTLLALYRDLTGGAP